METTTYRVLRDKCENCGSTRDTRGVGEYQIHDDGSETLINCSDCHLETEAEAEVQA